MHLSSLFHVISLFIITISGLPGSNESIVGFWENATKGLQLQIEETFNGIRVKRLDQNRWYYYQKIRPNQYRDSSGHTYYLLDQQSLEWEGSRGEKRLLFQRASNVADQKASQNGDVYIERNHFYGSAGQRYVSVRKLTGWWINKSTKQRIQVSSSGNQLLVQANESPWITFSRTDSNTFKDQKGNRYDYIDGQLAYLSNSGDFYMRFVPMK